MQPEMVIFSIDEGSNLHATAKFLRHIDTCRALGNLKGTFSKCIGFYDGRLEASYLMTRKDYDKFVVPLGFTEEQECILVVPGDTRQPCTLEFYDSSMDTLGPMREVEPEEAFRSEAWTFVEPTGKYYVTSSISKED